jgi:hypothetical protein
MLISQEFPSAYLKSDDLKGKEIKLIMARVEREKIGEDHRPVLYFRGTDKGLVLNKTNSFKIKESYGDDTIEWEGQPIILFSIMTDFQGKTVPGIRVRAPTAKEMRPFTQRKEEALRDEFVSALAPQNNRYGPDGDLPPIDAYDDER